MDLFDRPFTAGASPAAAATNPLPAAMDPSTNNDTDTGTNHANGHGPQDQEAPASPSASLSSRTFSTLNGKKLVPSSMFDDDDDAYDARFQATPSLPTAPLTGPGVDGSSSFSMSVRLAPTRPAFPPIPNAQTSPAVDQTPPPIPADPWKRQSHDVNTEEAVESDEDGDRSPSPSPPASPLPFRAQPGSHDLLALPASPTSSSRSATPVPPRTTLPFIASASASPDAVPSTDATLVADSTESPSATPTPTPTASHRTTTAAAASDPVVCRICRDESTPEEPLYTPCKCTGSIRHVHQACLTEWLSHSGKDKCEVCGARFQFKVVYAENMPTFLPVTVVVRNAIRGAAETVASAIRVLVVSEVWLVGLPLVFGFMWSKLFNIVRVPRLIGMGAGLENEDGVAVFGPEPRPYVPLGSSWIPAYLPPTLIESQLLCIITLITAVVLFVVKDWIADTARAILADDRRRLRELWADAVRHQPPPPPARRRRLRPRRLQQQQQQQQQQQLEAALAPLAPPQQQEQPDVQEQLPQPPLRAPLAFVDPFNDEPFPDPAEFLGRPQHAADVPAAPAPAPALAPAPVPEHALAPAPPAPAGPAFTFNPPPEAVPNRLPPVARPPVPNAVPGPEFDFGNPPLDPPAVPIPTDNPLALARPVPGPDTPAPVPAPNAAAAAAAPPAPRPPQAPPVRQRPDVRPLENNPEMAAFLAHLQEQVQIDPALHEAVAHVAGRHLGRAAAPAPAAPQPAAAAAAPAPAGNLGPELADVAPAPPEPPAPPAPAPEPPAANNNNLDDDDDDGPMQAGGLADLLGFAGPLTNLTHSLAMAVMILVAIVMITQWLPFVAGAVVLGLRPVHVLLTVAKWAAGGADRAADWVAGKILGSPGTAAVVPSAPQHVRYREMLVPARVVDWIDLAEHSDEMLIDSWTSRLVLIIIGWIALSLVGAAWIKLRAPKDPRIRLLKRTLARGGDAIAQSLKLVVFVAVEWFVFPAYTGMLVHLVMYPVTPATAGGFLGRIAWVQEHEWSAFYLHWLIGANVMFHQSTLVQAARQVLRPGVLWFVRDVSDPNFSPYADIATKPVKTLVRKIVLSMGVYSVVTCVLGSTACLVIWDLVGVVRTPNVALLGAPIDLVIVGAAGPWIAAKVPAYTVTRWVVLTVLALLGRVLRLTGFLFGGWHEDELSGAPTGKSLWHRILLDPVKLEHVRPAHVPIGKAESLASHPVLEQHRIAVEQGKVEARSVALRGEQGLYRVPAYDMVPVDHEPKQMLFAVDVDGHDLPVPRTKANTPEAVKSDEAGAAANSTNESEWESDDDADETGTDKTTPEPNWNHWTFVYLPSRFTVRWLVLVFGVVSVIGSALGLLVAVPILIGRFDIPRMIYDVFGADPSRVMVAGRLHDMYAWVYGVIVLAGVISGVSFVATVAVGLSRRRAQRSQAAQVDDGEQQQDLPSLLSRTGRVLRLFCTWVWLLGLAGGMFPLFVGRVGHAMVVVPLRMALNGHHPLPLFVEQVVATGEWKTIAWQWCCGFLCVQIGLCLLEVAAPNSAVMERISRSFPNGVPDFSLLNHELFFPGAYYLTAFLVTRLAVSSMLLQFFPDVVPKDTHETFSTSFVAWGLMAAIALRYHLNMLRDWLQSVRDQEYQVTRLLQNVPPAQQGRDEEEEEFAVEGEQGEDAVEVAAG